MNDNKDSHRPAGLIWLLIYQWILVVIALFYSWDVIETIAKEGGSTTPVELFLLLVAMLVLACWGIAMAVASIGIIRRSPRGFLIGIICHLLLEIPGLSLMLYFGFAYVFLSFSDHESRAWAPLVGLFALMWLPFVLISGWAFFYLRRLRKSLLAQGPQNVAGLMP
jgi:hypothetical protein